jgi:hypothetical protein
MTKNKQEVEQLQESKKNKAAEKLAKDAKRKADFKKTKAAMSPQNRERVEAAIAAKTRPLSSEISLTKVNLSAEREQQLAEMEKRYEADKAILLGWGQRLADTSRKVGSLKKQYRQLLYSYMQEAYGVYSEAVSHVLAESFFDNVRGALRTLNIPFQSNTPDASLVAKLILGADTSNKSASEYGKVMEAALARGVKSDKFAEWLNRETITKVLADQRSIEKEIETPKDRLERARRLILRLIDIRDSAPIISHQITAHAAEKNLGKHYGLCVALGHANRRMDRQSFYADINFSLIFPVSLDFEIYIVDKLARHMMGELDDWEKKLDELTEEVWADQLFEKLIAACDEEVDKNNEYWANRQQAQLHEDQQEFARLVKQRKTSKSSSIPKTKKSSSVT